MTQALENKEGQSVPTVNFKCRVNNEWQCISSDDLFKNKTVIVFALPGAFTPTCSATHLPRYNDLAPVFKANGVDDIICMSVNDAFVMNEWARDQEADNIRLIPDGNGQFAEGMGMLVNKEDIGFGRRSWRYSMLVKDGIIEKMFIESNKPGDPFEVSDADTMLNYINPKAKAPEYIALFTREGCPYCAKAKGLLDEKNLKYEEIVLGKTITSKSLRAITGKTSVPQVFMGGKHIGGSEALEAYLKNC